MKSICPPVVPAEILNAAGFSSQPIQILPSPAPKLEIFVHFLQIHFLSKTKPWSTKTPVQ